jgi:hypothetical protein
MEAAPVGKSRGSRLANPSLRFLLSRICWKAGTVSRARGFCAAKRILIALMAIWVVSPFIALAWANLVSIRWPAPAGRMLYWVMLFLTIASLAVYGVDLTQ